MNDDNTKTISHKPPKPHIWLWLAILAVAVIGGIIIFSRKSSPKEASIGAPMPVAETGHRVKLPIVINTAGQTINAAQIYLKFDPKVVQVESVSKEGSFFTLWVTDQPKFDNKSGHISFAGGIFTPGFHGQGQVGSVTLVAKSATKSQLTFTNTQVLLNDGQGTAVPLKLDPIQVNIQ